MATRGSGRPLRWLALGGCVLVAAGLAVWMEQRGGAVLPTAAPTVVARPVPAPPPPTVHATGLPAEASVPRIPALELASLEERFRNDGVDGAWSVPAEQQLTEAASEPALTALGLPDDFRASCAAHLCRIAMHFPSRQAADDWAQFYPVGVGSTLGALRVEETFQADGGVRLLVFGARPGYAPMLAPVAGRPPAPSGR